MKHLLFTIYFIVLTVLSFGQTCLPDGITFVQQSQIDSFPILYPGCTEILGDVLINSSDIASLQGLDRITRIHGLLRIGGTLFFANNMGLLNISGFNELERIGGDFRIAELVIISQLDGFNSLRTIGGLFGFAGTLITTVNGLSSLDTIGGFRLGYNERITDLDWMEDLEYIGSGSMTLEYNYMLSFCATQAVCDHLLGTNLINQIYSNFEGCDSIEEVLHACILSTGDQAAPSSFYVYPNPTTDRINVVINSPNNNDEYDWQLVDAMGNILQRFVNLEDDINLFAFPNGLYTLVLKERASGKIAGRRVIKND